MGISIYIKKSAINVLSTTSEVVHYGCTCDLAIQNGEFCPICQEVDEYETFCVIEGLDILMHDFGDAVYHVANTWGRSRQPILDFIRTKGIADEDWYEG